MAPKKTDDCTENDLARCCRVESIVTVDERGQMVLPKDLRKNAGINPGDKLALVACEGGESKGCIVMMKVDDLAGLVKNALGPMLSEIIKS